MTQDTRRVFDVDIDVNRHCEKGKYGTRAMIYDGAGERINLHPSGYYLEPVPVDKELGCAAIDYEYGEAMGFQKVDLLTNSSYNGFFTKEEVISAMESEPMWEKLTDPEFVARLPHIGKHFDIIERIRPTSIEQLADVLALIRPGKLHLLEPYLINPKNVRRRLYVRAANDAVYFKKSHSISYAAMIVCVMNKLTNRSFIKW